MKSLFAISLLAALFLAGLATPSAACTLDCGLKPFTAQVHYMSLAGYMRWQHYQMHNNWMPRGEAVAEVKEGQLICAKK